ncbi:MAG: fasciclin domain-containing protein [Cyclobacteriaceae bacterium]|nr:fasciclin domain-containing protein [Cyclobacteriaceae bacterium]
MKFIITLTGIAFLLFTACSDTSNQDNTSSAAEERQLPKGQSTVLDEVSEKNILHVAIGSPDHTTLVAAVQAAELEDVLTNAGPLTVFAPTNEAFAALPEGTLDDLLKPENKATLARIITFHAAPGSYNENNIKGVMGIGQATGDKVNVEVEGDVTTVNGAKVLGTVKASNGYVHVIDQVLLPPEK